MWNSATRHYAGTAVISLAALGLLGCGGGGSGPAPLRPLPASVAASAPSTAEVNQAVAFASDVSPPLDSFDFSWTFGDGTSSNQPQPQHGFAIPGTYQVQLSLGNGSGETRKATVNLRVGHFSNLQSMACSGAANLGWCLQRPRGDAAALLPGGGPVGDLFFADATTGWMLSGSFGDASIWKSVDGGASWSRSYRSPVATQLIQIGFADPLHGWAVDCAFDAKEPSTTAPALLRTIDGGATWQALNPSWSHQVDYRPASPCGSSRHPPLTILDNDSALIAGYITLDGGRTWAVQPGGLDAWKQAWRLGTDAGPNEDEPHATVVWRSANLGQTSAVALRLPCPAPGIWGRCRSFALNSLDDQKAWVLGVLPVDAAHPTGMARKLIWQTVDGGATWASTEVPWLPVDLDGGPLRGEFKFYSANTGWFVERAESADVFSALRTADGGKTWSPLALPAPVDASGVLPIFVYDVNTLSFLAAGTRYRFLTRDAGLNWKAYPAFVREGGQDRFDGELYREPGWSDSAFRNGPVLPSIAWSNSALLRTDDGGVLWRTVRGQDYRDRSNRIGVLWFFDAKRGVALGSNGYVLNTTDGGVTWNRGPQVGAPTDRTSALALQFVSASQGWLVRSGSLLMTGDAGVTWSPVPLPGNPRDVASMHFVDAQRGWVVSDSGGVFATVDGGSAWVEQGPLSGGLGAVRFANANVGIALGLDGRVWRTDNAGATWTPRAGPATGVLQQLTFVDSSKAWAVGSGGLVASSADAGATWTSVVIPGCGHCVFGNVFFTDASNGWVVGGAAIYATRDGGSTWAGQPLPIQTLGGQFVFPDQVFFVDAFTGWAGDKSNGGIWATATGGQP